MEGARRRVAGGGPRERSPALAPRQVAGASAARHLDRLRAHGPGEGDSRRRDRPGGLRAAVGRSEQVVSATIDTEHFRRRLLEDRTRVQEALDYLHEENPGSMEDETQE